jgi:diguanylate cyclase (GGDEF)-like protein/PAS domain S-box-containing protein
MQPALETLLDASADLVCVTDPSGTLTRVNPAVPQMLGWSAGALLGKPLLDLIVPGDRAAVVGGLAELRAGMPVVGFESRCTTRDGATRSVRWAAHAEPDEGRIYVVGKDVTERWEEDQRFRAALVEASPTAMILVDGEGLIRLANPEAERLLGYGSGELLHRSIEDLVPVDLRDAHGAHRRQFGEAPTPRPMGHRRDLMAVRRDGTTFPVEVGLNPVPTPLGTMVLCAVLDLSERREAEQSITEWARELAEMNRKLVALATTDSLTTLWNRRSFLDQMVVQMELAARTTRPMSILMLDVDHFKDYNDRFGHLAGDEVLRGVAKVLREVNRRSDYAARIGGEEFGIILPETDTAGARRIAERFRESVDTTNWPRRHITVSLGATTALFRQPGDHLDPAVWRSRVLAEADRALYHSKDAGRNRVTHISDIAMPSAPSPSTS